MSPALRRSSPTSTGAARRGCRARPSCGRTSPTCSPSPPSTSWSPSTGCGRRSCAWPRTAPSGRRRRSPAAAAPGAAIADQAADDKVLAALADGSTLVLQGLHRTWPPLVDFGARLADELGHPVQINAYITPPQNQGFAPHHDVHDVFVLQVSGRKHWTVHPPVVDDPLGNQPFDGFKAEIAERVDRAAADRHRPRAGGRALPPARDGALRRGAGRDVDPPDRRRPPADPLRAGAVPARRGAGRPASCAHRCPMGADLADPDVLAPHLAATVAALQAALERVPGARIAERLGTQPHAAHPPAADRPARRSSPRRTRSPPTPRCGGAARCGCGSSPATTSG